MENPETPKEDYNFTVEKNDNGGFSVYLPHQCDEWKILGAGVSGFEKTNEYIEYYPYLPKNPKIAIKQMELFVKRAQEALEKLRRICEES